jgi:hypothetical protein
VAALTYVAITFLPEKYTAFYKLELPSSVHPYIADPIFIAAIKNDTAAKASFVNGDLAWTFEAQSEKDAIDAVTAARNAALDAVSGLTPADIAVEGENAMGLSAAGVARQVSTVKRWAEILKEEPVAATSNVKRGVWVATLTALSFIFVLLFLIIRNIIRSAEKTPEGAAKMAKIRESLVLRRKQADLP